MTILKGIFENPADTFKIGASYLIGGFAMAFCLWAAWTQGSDPALQVLLCIFGGSLGWILGLYVTPSNEGEKQQFSDFGKTLAALVSGFSLAKIEVLLAWARSSFEASEPSITAKRALLFVSSLLILALFTFISRRHVRGSSDALKSQREKAFAEVSEALSKLKALN